MLTGLTQRKGIWHIDKHYRGRRIRGTTGETDRRIAEDILIKEMERIRNEDVFGVQPEYPFHEILTRYCFESRDKKTIKNITRHAITLINLLGETLVSELNDKSFDVIRKELYVKKNLTPAAVNRVLEVARAALRAGHLKWRDDNNRPWVQYPVHISLYPKKKCTRESRRRPYPLTPTQEKDLYAAFTKRGVGQIPMLQFIANTGVRDQDACQLSWDMEQYEEELGRSIFYIDGEKHKNGTDRIVILNDVAWNIVEKQRGKHPIWVFPSIRTNGEPYKFNPGGKTYSGTSKQFQNAWVKAGLPTEGFRVGVHNLKHTFGARLLQVGCPDRYVKIFLGHTSSNVTDIYTEGEITSMIKFANRAAKVKTGVITRQIYKKLETLE